ncbi:concanavalin A-like lectin/glucanase domain-containing protein [Kalaharituber pfeilii]|nr:concanavalin A-like lectin/glucanase domain-containing protein [Kalaharituber pfeilii]
MPTTDRFYLVKLNTILILSSPFQAEGILMFQSGSYGLSSNYAPTASTVDNSQLNFVTSSGDYGLHISFRRHENIVVFNTRRSGKWDDEERIQLQGAFIRHGATVTVYDQGDRYQIMFDGRTVHMFNKRVHEPVVQVSYMENPEKPRPLSATLAVTQFQTLGQLVSGRAWFSEQQHNSML